MNPLSLGLVHFFQQADSLGQFLSIILLIMSVLSWYLLLFKGLRQWACRRRGQSFLDRFWKAKSMADVDADLKKIPHNDPFSRLTFQALQAKDHHDKFGAASLADSGTLQDFLTRHLKKNLDEETMHMENGLTILATIGATAPFVGLFGTVWGV